MGRMGPEVHHTLALRTDYVTHCNTLQHTATHCNTLQHTQTCVRRMGREVHRTLALRTDYARVVLLLRTAVVCVAVCCSVLQCVAVCCSVLQCVDKLHHEVTHVRVMLASCYCCTQLSCVCVCVCVCVYVCVYDMTYLSVT